MCVNISSYNNQLCTGYGNSNFVIISILTTYIKYFNVFKIQKLRCWDGSVVTFFELLIRQALPINNIDKSRPVTGIPTE